MYSSTHGRLGERAEPRAVATQAMTARFRSKHRQQDAGRQRGLAHGAPGAAGAGRATAARRHAADCAGCPPRDAPSSARCGTTRRSLSRYMLNSWRCERTRRSCARSRRPCKSRRRRWSIFTAILRVSFLPAAGGMTVRAHEKSREQQSERERWIASRPGSLRVNPSMQPPEHLHFTNGAVGQLRRARTRPA